MKCTRCGAELLPNDAFCGSCGSPVSAPEPVPVIPEPVIAQPVIPEPVIAQPVIPVAPAEPQPVPAVPVAVHPMQTPPAAPKPKKEKKPHRHHKPPLAARVVLRITSVLLSLLLCLSLLVTAVIIDIQCLTSQGSIQKVVGSIIMEDSGNIDVPLTLAKNSIRKSSGDSSRDQLAAWLYDILKDTGGEKMTVTEDQLAEFLERSTADEYLTEKVSGFMADFLNGTEKTKVRKADIVRLMDENADLIEDIFGSRPDSKMKQDVLSFMDQHDVENVVHDKVFRQLEDTALFGSGRNAYKLGDLMSTLRKLTSVSTLINALLVDLLLIILLFLTHWFRLGATVRTVGICMTSVGFTLALPTLLLQCIPSLLSGLGSELIAGILRSIISVFAGVHYTMFGLGIVAIIAAIVISIVSKVPKT